MPMQPLAARVLLQILYQLAIQWIQMFFSFFYVIIANIEYIYFVRSVTN